ncbi:hypothetical protein GCM10009847_03040 [Leucobacter tardus]|uniref:Uncharacterized protein n=1 Tax=Leucobacter tardus TaxID=501483 RepID=A0A939TQ32_9MICO|nr:hypothetical protein [Leucobacter tardus]MBO2988512.1 hypothetical protein [Leucobacter tardus]
MRSGRARSILTLLLAFALFTPTFWIIDAMQEASASAASGSVKSTLRFDESRSEQETLVEPTLRFDESRSEQQIVLDDGSDDAGVAGSDADDAGEPISASPVVKHLSSLASPPGARAMVELRLPPLMSVDRVRLSRLLLPEQPLMRVATPPPLLPA